MRYAHFQVRACWFRLEYIKKLFLFDSYWIHPVPEMLSFSAFQPNCIAGQQRRFMFTSRRLMSLSLQQGIKLDRFYLFESVN